MPPWRVGVGRLFSKESGSRPGRALMAYLMWPLGFCYPLELNPIRKCSDVNLDIAK